MDMFWYPHEAVRAAQMLGMRVSTGGFSLIFPALGNAAMRDISKRPKNFHPVILGVQTCFPRVMPHGAYTVSPEHLRDAKSIADADRGLFCTHAAETRAEQADIQTAMGAL